MLLLQYMIWSSHKIILLFPHYLDTNIAIIFVPVQFIAGVCIELGPGKSDCNVDVVPQIHFVGHLIPCLSWLLFTAHAKTEKIVRRSFRLASFKKSIFLLFCKPFMFAFSRKIFLSSSAKMHFITLNGLKLIFSFVHSIRHYVYNKIVQRQ